jgi:hypothetical protein
MRKPERRVCVCVCVCVCLFVCVCVVINIPMNATCTMQVVDSLQGFVKDCGNQRLIGQAGRMCKLHDIQHRASSKIVHHQPQEMALYKRTMRPNHIGMIAQLHLHNLALVVVCCHTWL